MFITYEAVADFPLLTGRCLLQTFFVCYVKNQSWLYTINTACALLLFFNAGMGYLRQTLFDICCRAVCFRSSSLGRVSFGREFCWDVCYDKGAPLFL